MAAPTKVNTSLPSKTNFREMAKMDIDEFMRHGLDSKSSDDDEETDESDGSGGGDGELSMSVPDAAETENSVKSKTKTKKTKQNMKSSMERLQEKDPEFYKFLQQNDRNLLNFSESDDSLSEEEDGESGGKFHRVPQKLVVDSEDSEGIDSSDEAEDERKNKTVKDLDKRGQLVSLKMVSQWSEALEATPSVVNIKKAILVFRAAVRQAGDAEEEEDEEVNFKVTGSAVFNAVVRMCLANLIPALDKVMKMPKSHCVYKKTRLPSTSKAWRKLKTSVRKYLLDVIKLFSEMSEPTILSVVLKHIHMLVPYYVCHRKPLSILTKKLIRVWSTSSEEAVRVLAFLCIIRITKATQEEQLSDMLKHLYMAYVKNCKFTSPNTLPMINFMQRSMVEVFRLDERVAYQHAFVFIRQLAIHLRNAITMKKKEHYQAVYNWQYVHCLFFWARLLSTVYPSEVLEPLIYPLVQTTIGCINLVPTAKYYPLRFHCIKALTMLTGSTDVFIPVLPFILEVFEITDFNRKHVSVGFKPINFDTSLKLSKSQLQEKGFRDGVIDQVYELTMEYLNTQTRSIGYPELVLPAVLRLKKFLKLCKVANFCKPVKQLLDKIMENSTYVTDKRKSVTFAVSDFKAVEQWERQIALEETPIGKYYISWRKLRDRELAHEIAGKERIVDRRKDIEIPSVTRSKRQRQVLDKFEYSALLPSDSDEESEEELLKKFDPEKERPRKRQKLQQEDDDDDDGAESLDSDELAELDLSGDDESADENDGDSETRYNKNTKVKNDAKDADDDVNDVDDVVEDFRFSSSENDD